MWRQFAGDRLDAPFDHGLLERVPADAAHIDQGHPKRARYRLTPKSRDLVPALVALMLWGDRWISGRGNEPVVARTSDGKAITKDVMLDRTGTPVRDVAGWQAGPGCDERTAFHLRQLRGQPRRA